MFAIIKTGGKQYKVQVGETIDVEKLPVETGGQVHLDQVLLASNNGDVAYGRPVIDGAMVTARVVSQYKGPKLIVFKYKSKSRYRRRTGHRQNLTQLLVQSIEIPGWETVRIAVRRAPVDTEAAVVAPQVITAEEATASVAAPAMEEAPVTQGTAPVTQGTAPVTQGTAPVTQGTAPVTQGTAPVTQGTAPVTVSRVDEAPVLQDATAPAPAVEELPASGGSAAPPNDVLPAVTTTAQVEAMDEGLGSITPLPDMGHDEPPAGLP